VSFPLSSFSVRSSHHRCPLLPATMSAGLMGPVDVARATGVSTDTLRHYERQGPLPGVTRTSAGYRRYSATAVQRVQLIQRALVVGFSLADLRRVLAARDKAGAPCASVRELARTLELNELAASAGRRHDVAGLCPDDKSVVRDTRRTDSCCPGSL
jgi:DNA-binding transcriptional MerR regulator